MITREQYIDKMRGIFNKYEEQYQKDINLLNNYSEILKELSDAHLIRDIKNEYQVAEKYASLMASATHIIEFCFKEITTQLCANYLKGYKERMEEHLSIQYDEIADQFNRVYEHKDGSNKYKVRAYDGFEYRFKAIDKIKEFSNLMSVEFNKDEFKEWKESIFETKYLKLKIYKNNNLEIVVK